MLFACCKPDTDGLSNSPAPQQHDQTMLPQQQTVLSSEMQSLEYIFKSLGDTLALSPEEPRDYVVFDLGPEGIWLVTMSGARYSSKHLATTARHPAADCTGTVAFIVSF